MIQKLHTYLTNTLTETESYHSKISDIAKLLLSLQRSTVQSIHDEFYDEELHMQIQQLVKYFIAKYPGIPPRNLSSTHSESKISEVPSFTKRSS